MRMNFILRSIAETIGAEYKSNIGGSAIGGVRQAREYLKHMGTKDWGKALPKKKALSAEATLTMSAPFGFAHRTIFLAAFRALLPALSAQPVELPA
jgi:hypothetical protein